MPNTKKANEIFISKWGGKTLREVSENIIRVTKAVNNMSDNSAEVCKCEEGFAVVFRGPC